MCLLAMAGQTHAQQSADPTYQPSVTDPAYADAGPVVAIDEAHANQHTVQGTYGPFARLLRADGYTVRASTSAFSAGTLRGIDVLVIANARVRATDATGSAFTEEECDAVQDWVRAGGALLVVADHAPSGDAADLLARHFGVLMGKGFAFNRPERGPLVFDIRFSRQTKSLGEHSILRGRGPSEVVEHVDTFEGQSLGLPAGATALLPLGPNAWEATQADVRKEALAALAGAGERGHAVQVSGRAQGLALEFGKGRVVMFGEAAMLTAQVMRRQDGTESKFGMNVPGNHNRQFVLNVLHWLSRVLP